MVHSKLGVAAAALVAVLGCNTTPEQDVKKATQAQREASKEISEIREAGAAKVHALQEEATKAHTEVQQASAQARDEVIEKAAAVQQELTKASNEVARETAEVQAEANKTIRAAKEDIVKARGDLREWSQKEVNEIDGVIDSARAKAVDATAAQKANFDRMMRDIQAKRAALGKQLATLETQSASALSKFESRMHTQIDDLKTRVEKLRSAL